MSELTTRQNEIAARFMEFVNGSCGGPVTLSRQIDVPDHIFTPIAAGNAVVTYALALKVARNNGLSLTHLGTGTGSNYARPEGLGWLEWAPGKQNLDGPFEEIYDQYLASFAERAGTERCAFKLCRDLDLAKVALATGTMSATQEAALRAAVVTALAA